MQYAIKTIRDTRTNKITVSEIIPAPDNIAPCDKKYGAYAVEYLLGLNLYRLPFTL